jgi:hypothetical protein
MRALWSAVALALLAGPALADFQDCTTPEFAKSFLGDAQFKCEEISTRDVEAMGRTVHMRSLREKNDTRGLQYEPIVMNAAETTLAWLTPFAESKGLKIQDITFVFPQTELHDQVHAYGRTRIDASSPDCVVSIFTHSFDVAADAPLDKLSNTVAHELFHCIQTLTWPTKKAEGRDWEWWSEGSAQFIAHWIFEEPSDLAERGKAFATASRSLPLYKGSAFGEEVVLMAWITRGEKIGKLFDFIASMPDIEGAEAQRDALLKFVGAAGLADFARAYLNGAVAMPSGTAFVPPKQTLSSEVISSKELALQVTPFTVFSHDVSFMGGKYYGTTSGSPDLEYKEAPTPDADWKIPMMLSIEQGCDADQTLRFGGMATGLGGDETYTLSITKEPGCEDCAVTDTRNSCLTGTWIADAGDLADMVEGMQPEQLSGAKVDGKFAVKFDNTGKAMFGFYKFRLTGKPAIAGAPKFSVDIGGTIDNLWSTGGKHLQMCFVSANAALQIGVPGAMSDPILFADLPMQKSQQYDFTCSDDGQTLDLQGDLDGKPFKMRFARAPEP